MVRSAILLMLFSNVRLHIGNPKAHSDIYQELMSTALAEALCIVSDDQIEEYCEYYIQDFLQSVHFVSHDKSNDEHEVIILISAHVM